METANLNTHNQNTRNRILHTGALEISRLALDLYRCFSEYLVPPKPGVYNVFHHYPVMVPEKTYIARGTMKPFNTRVTVLVKQEYLELLKGFDFFEIQGRLGARYELQESEGVVFLYAKENRQERVFEWQVVSASDEKNGFLVGMRQNEGMPYAAYEYIKAYILELICGFLTFPTNAVPPSKFIQVDEQSSHLVAKRIEEFIEVWWEKNYGTGLKSLVEKMVGPYYTHRHSVLHSGNRLLVQCGIDQIAYDCLEKMEMAEALRQDMGSHI